MCVVFRGKGRARQKTRGKRGFRLDTAVPSINPRKAFQSTPSSSCANKSETTRIRDKWRLLVRTSGGSANFKTVLRKFEKNPALCCCK